MKKRFRLHKTYGTSRIVVVECDHMEIRDGGTILFWADTNSGFPKSVIAAYPPHAWRYVEEIVGDD